MLIVKLYDLKSGPPEPHSRGRYLSAARIVATFKNVLEVKEAIIPSHILLMLSEEGRMRTVLVPVQNYLVEIHENEV